jgi:hypothetical protein
VGSAEAHSASTEGLPAPRVTTVAVRPRAGEHGAPHPKRPRGLWTCAWRLCDALRAAEWEHRLPFPPAVIAALEELEAIRREYRGRWAFYKQRERAQPPRAQVNRLHLAQLVAGILVRHDALKQGDL